MDRFGPMRGEGESETIELHIAEISTANAPRAHAIAESFGRRRAEFAGATIIAIAGLYVIRFEAPFGFSAHNSCGLYMTPRIWVLR
jgi:hypothetical protein